MRARLSIAKVTVSKAGHDPVRARRTSSSDPIAARIVARGNAPSRKG
jgi:hypothetical protein